MDSNPKPSVWLNGWAFIYKLSGCGFEPLCSHLNFRYRACFEQGVPWHSGNYRVWIYSETCTWHDKNIHSDFISVFYVLILLKWFTECEVSLNKILKPSRKKCNMSCKNLGREINDKEIFIFYWQLDRKEIIKQNRVIIGIYICKLRTLLVYLFKHVCCTLCSFLCNFFFAYFYSFSVFHLSFQHE